MTKGTNVCKYIIFQSDREVWALQHLSSNYLMQIVGEGTVSKCDHFCIDDCRVQIGKLRHTVAKNTKIVDGQFIFTVNARIINYA